MKDKIEPKSQVSTPKKPASVRYAKVGHNQGTGTRKPSTKNDKG